MSGEGYDPREGHWAPIPDMQRAKLWATASTIGGRLAVLGMDFDTQALDFFNPVANQWQAANGPPECRGAVMTWCPWRADTLIR